MTEKLGFSFAPKILESKEIKSRAFVLFLKGDLGSGKTRFAVGVLKYFGIKPLAASPTFVIQKRYLAKKNNKNVKEIFHIDAYRLKNKKDLKAIDFNKTKDKSGTIIIMEWPEKVKGIKSDIVINFLHTDSENQRVISF